MTSILHFYFVIKKDKNDIKNILFFGIKRRGRKTKSIIIHFLTQSNNIVWYLTIKAKGKQNFSILKGGLVGWLICSSSLS